MPRPPPQSTLFPYTTLFRSEPEGDGQFLSFVTDPELAKLIPVLYPGVTTPPPPRNDLVAVFLTGLPGLNQPPGVTRSEEHTSELQSHSDLVCRLLLEKKK